VLADSAAGNGNASQVRLAATTLFIAPAQALMGSAHSIHRAAENAPNQAEFGIVLRCMLAEEIRQVRSRRQTDGDWLLASASWAQLHHAGCPRR
jgi:hypothetical protein